MSKCLKQNVVDQKYLTFCQKKKLQNVDSKKLVDSMFCHKKHQKEV